MQKILVTGGAGYIGSHTCKALSLAGFEPITFDNLSRGFEKSVLWGPLVKGDLLNPTDLSQFFRDHKVSAVMHFAAFAYIKESVEKPLMYFENNVMGTALLVEAMIEAGVKNLIFSSTCATYGESTSEVIGEDHPQKPINPYGLSKLMVERILTKYCELDLLDFCALRYFNAAGADLDLEIGENHDPEPHLIPTLIQKAMAGEPMTLNGDDYPTPDGTCIRDFIHVSDLAEAHVLALKALLSGDHKEKFYNLGGQQGHSLKEVAQTVLDVTGSKSPLKIAPRRPGDPAKLIGDPTRFSKEFNWRPRHKDLKTMIESGHQWILKKH